MNKTGSVFNSIMSIAAAAVFAVVFDIPANAKTEVTPAETIQIIEYKSVDRTDVVRKFLEKYKSPLTQNAQTFVDVADKYNLDYKILPAISCMESTCGKFLIPESYNPFGWGGGYIYFSSYDEAIEGVGKGLDEIYLSRGLDTPEKMGPIYTPPNYANWVAGVKSFMREMEKLALEM